MSIISSNLNLWWKYDIHRLDNIMSLSKYDIFDFTLETVILPRSSSDGRQESHTSQRRPTKSVQSVEISAEKFRNSVAEYL